jgi:amidase
MKQFAGLLSLGAAFVTLVLLQPSMSKAQSKTPSATVTVFEASIPEMQSAMKAGRVTSHGIVQQYLTRIALYEDKLNAAITVNPSALKEADERDRERAQGHVRGPCTAFRLR